MSIIHEEGVKTYRRLTEGFLLLLLLLFIIKKKRVRELKENK